MLHEAARRERARGRRVMVKNIEMWVEGKKWSWNERRMSWEEEI